MRVGLSTSWGIRCGMAEYAANLVTYIKGAEFKIMNDMSAAGTLRDSADVDIVHFNYHPAYHGEITDKVVFQLREQGKKVLLTSQFTLETGNRTPLNLACHRVVVPEPTDDGFEYIPLGIPVAKELPKSIDYSVSTVGFPFRWKSFPEIAAAARSRGLGFICIAPFYPATIAENVQVHQAVKEAHPDAIIYSNFLPLDDVLYIIGQSAVTVSAFGGPGSPGNGICSSIRYNLATKRPAVAVRYRMYRDLFGYEDEICFADSASAVDLAAAIDQAVIGVKVPKRVLEEVGWPRCAEKYEQLYRELMTA